MKSPAEPAERRKKGPLRLEVQRKVAIRLTTQWFSAAIVAVVLTLLVQYFNNPTLPADERSALQSQLWGPMALAFLATAPIVVLDLARFAHSVAGPIVRLRRLVGELADGKPVQPVSFRKGDQWHDLAHEFNRLLAEVDRLRAIEAEHANQATNAEACSLV